MSKDLPSRYHPLQVGFHWLVVGLLFAMFLLGRYMSGLPNDGGKIFPLGAHILLGVLTVAVIVIRFIARFRLAQPVPARTGNAILDLAGKAVHYALYLLVLLMAISGISLSLRAGLLPIVFGGSGAALPADFFVYSARALHGIVARLLVLMVGLHVAAALYHQLLLKDRLLSRMWFKKTPAAERSEQA